MPSMLVVWREDENGRVYDKQAMPIMDEGEGSVQAQAEEERFRNLGYKTRIDRKRPETVSDMRR